MQRSSQPGSTPNRALPDDAGGAKWFRQPVLWLAALIFVASLVGCLVTILLASRNADAPVPTTGGKVMRVPASR